MYWVAYYLGKGHNLSDLLKLSELEKMIYQRAMFVAEEERVKYDVTKLKALTGGE